MKLVDTLLQTARRRVEDFRDQWRPEFRNFMQLRRGEAPLTGDGKKVVLINQYNWFRYPTLYINSLVCPAVAEGAGASMETFNLTPKRHEKISRLYRSFGALPGLGAEDLARHAARAEKEADRLLAGVKTKWDLLALEYDGVRIGDLVYDMFLRYSVIATPDLTHPRVREFTREAIRVALAGEEYFQRKEVISLFPDHTLFVRSGVMTRLAHKHRVPVYLTPFTPDFFIQRLDPQLAMGMENPAKRWSYYRYQEIFNGLPKGVQDAGRQKAAEWLGRTLSGEVRDNILMGRSAYAAAGSERLLADTPTPKILILLHDFCDNVHCFRKMLFPDFYEWARHLFAQASKTKWEWYVKPHPNALTASAKAKIVLNDKILAALSEEFPSIHILPPKASNRQLVDEGLSAAFTVHGTVGYELAYLGLPVVNAGDNLQLSFPFNLNPQTVEEFDRLVENAGCLDHPIDKKDVEAFAYMQHFYIPEKFRGPQNPIDKGWRDHPSLWIRYSTELLAKSGESASLGYFVQTETAERRTAIRDYARRAIAQGTA